MLLVFSISVIKPMLPYLDYAINQEYIAENLCENIEKPQLECNGKCHLQKELEKAVEEESPVNSPENKKKSEEQTYICSNFNATINFNTLSKNTSWNSIQSESTLSRASKPQVPPPQFV